MCVRKAHGDGATTECFPTVLLHCKIAMILNYSLKDFFNAQVCSCLFYCHAADCKYAAAEYGQCARRRWAKQHGQSWQPDLCVACTVGGANPADDGGAFCSATWCRSCSRACRGDGTPISFRNCWWIFRSRPCEYAVWAFFHGRNGWRNGVVAYSSHRGCGVFLLSDVAFGEWSGIADVGRGNAHGCASISTDWW